LRDKAKARIATPVGSAAAAGIEAHAGSGWRSMASTRRMQLVRSRLPKIAVHAAGARPISATPASGASPLSIKQLFNSKGEVS